MIALWRLRGVLCPVRGFRIKVCRPALSLLWGLHAGLSGHLEDTGLVCLGISAAHYAFIVCLVRSAAAVDAHRTDPE